MNQSNDPKFQIAWKIYKYVRYKPELVKEERIADLLLLATKYLCEHSSFNSFQELIIYLNNNADKENAIRVEEIFFSDDLFCELK